MTAGGRIFQKRAMEQALVVGAGPVGLTLAAELARHGVRPRVIDRRAAPLPYCRAIGVTPRTLEVWEDMGVAREAVDAGLWLEGMRSVMVGQGSRDSFHDYDDLPYGELGLPQYETERLLEVHLARFGVTVERGVSLVGLGEERADGLEVHLERADGAAETLRAAYVVGCDGAHSTLRHALGIAFEGEAFPMLFMLGDLRIDWDLPRGMALRALRLVEDGPPDMFVAIPLPERNRYRVSTLAPPELEAKGQPGAGHGIQAERDGPTLAQLQAVANDLLPGRPTLGDLRWSSTFRISMRLAERYRRGRGFLAGDAAHIHPPTGGQGMNTGIQDAYNLAWKLALVLRGTAPATLLDSYEAERRPVGAEVVERTRAASVGYGREGGRAPHRLADSQILVAYRDSAWVRDAAPELDDSAPRPGERAPDAGGLRRHHLAFPLRLFELLRGTAHVLLLHRPDGLGETEAEAALSLAAAYGEDLRLVAVTGAGAAPPASSGLAVCEDAAGAFAAAYGAAPASFLVRPDGHLAWRAAGESLAGLADVLQGTLGGLGHALAQATQGR